MLKMNAFQYRLVKTMCEFSANVAFDKATNGQTDIKHEMSKILNSMSLLKTVDEKLQTRWELFTYDLQQ